MSNNNRYDLDALMSQLKERAPNEDAFHQAVEEVFEDLVPYANERPELGAHAILERLTEPDRLISFRVSWEADDGTIEVNRGFRVQFNSAIGPYKGGLRFHPSVSPSILKFLGFEQTFKNALTGLPMGGGKGGANFDPTGRSDREIMRFCTAFMTELHRHIGPDIDVPAGDINVGAREIGYLFGAYRRITNGFEGALTGKGQSYGGSALRTEATGYGLLHFVTHMLKQQDDTVEGKRIVISGAGNVATYAAEKALALGATVVSLSDSDGTLRFDDGLDQDVIEDVRAIKAKSGSLEELADRSGAEWVSDTAPWGLACDVALPCATQNEMDGDGAKSLINAGCKLIAEGANMPLTADAISRVNDAGVLFGPAKAANAGGVAVSGLEIAQNRTRESRSRDTISEQLEDVMASVHEQCVEHGKRDDGSVDYAKGANIAAFKKIADAMIGQGIS